MFTAIIVGSVILVWRALAFIDDYLADVPVFRKIGSGLAVTIALFAIFDNAVFAAGTGIYLQHETDQWVAWFRASLAHVMKPITPPATTTTTP